MTADPHTWCRLRGIYWAILNHTTSTREELAEQLNAAQPITVAGHQLDLFNGTVPSAADVPMFTDRHNRSYTVTADDRVRPAT